jgi:hypothetical protein
MWWHPRFQMNNWEKILALYLGKYRRLKNQSCFHITACPSTHSFSRKLFLSVFITGVNCNAVFKVLWTSAESIRWRISAGSSSAEIGWSHTLQSWENVVVGQALQCNAWWAATAQAVNEMSQDCHTAAPTFQDASGKLLPPQMGKHLLVYCVPCWLSDLRNTFQMPNILPVKETSHIILKLF